MSLPPPLPRKPEARTEKVEDLVERVRRGLVRVPRFQRRLNWESPDVENLFDSIYRGYPIGSLLFYKRKAEAERLRVGPLKIDAEEIPEAWWVVDGQQRVTTLAVCLARSVPIPTKPSRQDPFVLYFDARKQKFEPPQTSGRIPSTWVPLPHLLDASRLSEWVFGWQHGQDKALRRLVFEAGTRIREYPIPLYLIETEDSQVAQEIFYRVNKTGKPLGWTDVHKALFGVEGAFPSTLQERVLSFLRQDAGIPHLRLLPKSILLDVLTRFLALHKEPKPRTRMLLARWFWRTVLGAGAFDDRTLRRRGISAVGEDEEQSVQKLLRLLHSGIPRPLELPPSFDARADESRIALLALVHLDPRDLRHGQRIDVAGILEEEDKGAFVKILKQSGLELSRSPANRIIQAKGTPTRSLLEKRIAKHGSQDSILASHAIDPQAARLLAVGDLNGFLASRSEALTAEVRNFGERMAAWNHSDRPSVDYILEKAGLES